MSAAADANKLIDHVHRVQRLDSCSYDIDFNGFIIKTTVTASADLVNDWIFQIHHTCRIHLHGLIVGLDTEWWWREETVAILQLCIGHRCLIFQLHRADQMPKSLVDFLQNERFKFVGKKVDNDIEKLKEDYGLVVKGNPCDLGDEAAYIYKDSRYRSMGLETLAEELLGVKMKKSKRITMSRWDANKLSYEQVEYACVDAYVSFKLGVLLDLLRRGSPLLGFKNFSVTMPKATKSVDSLEEPKRIGVMRVGGMYATYK